MNKKDKYLIKCGIVMAIMFTAVSFIAGMAIGKDKQDTRLSNDVDKLTDLTNELLKYSSPAVVEIIYDTYTELESRKLRHFDVTPIDEGV